MDMANSSVIKDKNLITISFGDETRVTVLDKLYQHDKGQILQFKDIPDGAQVEFSNSKMEKSIPEIVKDGAVPVPNSIVAENETVDVRVKYIDENSETTVKEVKFFVINGKEADYEIDPENEQAFREEIEGILNETKEAVKEAADKVEVNRKYLDEMEKKSTDTIENITTVGEAQINAINEVAEAKINAIEDISKGKLFDINGTAQAQVAALNRTAQAQIESINNVATKNIEAETNSIVQAAQGQIVGINRVANGQIDAINQKAAVQINAIIGTANTHIDAINKTATSQINAINQTAQAQAQAIDLQASEIYNNLGILPGTTTLKTMVPGGYQPTPYIIPRTGNYIRLDSMIINGSEVELNETNYLRVHLLSNIDGTGLSSDFNITETEKNYSLERYGSDYKYISLDPYYSSYGLDCTIKYTLLDYDVRAKLDELVTSHITMQSDILSLQEELNGVRYLIIGNAEEVEV